MSKSTLARRALSLACLTLISQLAASHAAAQTTSATNPPATQALSEVVVKSQHDPEALPAPAAGGKAARGARLGLLGNVDMLAAPVSATSYTQQAIQDQQARTLADVLQNDPSVRFTTNSGHMLENFRIRGLDTNSSSMALNGLYGMAPKGHIATEFIERVEVLRGPSTLLGGVAPSPTLGGTINVVTKRAGAKPVTELTTSYSSKSYGEAHVDVGRRFGDDGALGVRFNGAYGAGKTGVSDQDKGRRLGALALDYQGAQWNLSLDAYSGREKIKNGSQAMYGLTGGRGKVVALGQLVPVPDSDSNAFRGTSGHYEDNGLITRAELQINPDWSAYATAGAASSRGRGLMFGTRMIVTQPDGTATGYVYNVDTRSQDRTLEAGVRGRLTTGAVAHTLNASVSVLSHKEGSASVAKEGWAQNIYNPVTPPFPAAPAAPAFGTDDLLSSLALTDTLVFADDRVLLTLGARLQKIEQKKAGYDASRLSPSAGLVVKPWGQNVSLYANYMEGLSPGNMVPFAQGFLNEGETFKPYSTHQVEMGVKLRQGELTHTFSAFQIDKPTLINSADGLRKFEGGKQRLQGLEWTTFGQITPTLDLLGGVSYLKSKQRDTGKDSYGVPDWTVNLGTEWATPVAGLSIGGRVVYTGKQWVNQANTLQLPSAHRLDLNAKYKTQLGQTPVTFNAFIENATNRRYWSGMFGDGYAMPAPPRALRLAATFSF